MPVFSKTSYVDGPCSELVHPWQPSCVLASREFMGTCLVGSFKVYAVFYALTALTRGKGLKHFIVNSIPAVARSTVFLSLNGGPLLFWICVMRRLLGRFYYPTVIFVPAIICSVIAIFVERKERRGSLAVYMLTLAVEAVFRHLKSENWIRSVPYGEVLLFMTASGLLMRHLSLPGHADGLLESSVSLLRTPMFPSLVTSVLPTQGFGGWLSKVAQISLWSFIVGYAIKAALGSVGLVMKGPKALKKPRKVIQVLCNKWNFHLGAFLACYMGSFEVLSKLLEAAAVTGTTKATIAGALAGASMLLFRSPGIALYALFKSVESWYFRAVADGKLKSYYYGDVLLYLLATPIMLHLSVLEPYNVRKEYYAFLLRVSGNRLADFKFEALTAWDLCRTVEYVRQWKAAAAAQQQSRAQ